MNEVNTRAFKQKDGYFDYARKSCDTILQGCKTTKEMLSKVEIYYRAHRGFDSKSEDRLRSDYHGLSRILFEKMLDIPVDAYNDHESLTKAFESLCEEVGHDLKVARGLLRIVVTGRYNGPKLFEMLCILGKGATDHRLKISHTLLENLLETE